MALHLLQTALSDGELSADQLKRNLYAILTVSDQFIPAYGLKNNADQLLDSGIIGSAPTEPDNDPRSI